MEIIFTENHRTVHTAEKSNSMYTKKNDFTEQINFKYNFTLHSQIGKIHLQLNMSIMYLYSNNLH